MSKGYTTATLVAKELGRDLTAPQLDECADAISQAEDWIDLQAGRAWLVVTPITDELHTLEGNVVYLYNRPVTSVTSVTVRFPLVGAAETTLVAGEDYEIIDGPHGVILVSGVARAKGTFWPSDLIPRGTLLKTTYATVTPLPGDIQRAATLLVAHWMLPRLNGDMREVKTYSVGSGGDTFATTFDTAGVPDEIMRLVRARERVTFA